MKKEPKNEPREREHLLSDEDPKAYKRRFSEIPIKPLGWSRQYAEKYEQIKWNK